MASSSKERSQVDSGEHVDKVQGDGEEELEKETEDKSGRVKLWNVGAVAEDVDGQRLPLAPKVSICHQPGLSVVQGRLDGRLEVKLMTILRKSLQLLQTLLWHSQ